MKRFLIVGLVLVAVLFCTVGVWGETYQDFEYEIVDSKTVMITSYLGKASTVSIPSKIQGLPVTAIDSFAFDENKTLRSVTIPSSVETIGAYAFSDCTSLTRVTIPLSVETIENGAFNGCTSLTRVSIPSSVKTIGDYAFIDCKLTKVTLSRQTKAGQYAFDREVQISYTGAQPQTRTAQTPAPAAAPAPAPNYPLPSLGSTQSTGVGAVNQPCGSCGGSGLCGGCHGIYLTRCTFCNGIGKRTYGTGSNQSLETCVSCKGTGQTHCAVCEASWIPDGKCSTCKGTGLRL